MGFPARRGLWQSAVAVGAFASLALLGCGDSERTSVVAAQTQALAAPITVSFQNGVAPAATYGGTTDATIRQATPSTNLGSATTCRADGDETGGADLGCLLRWEMIGIPLGSTIQSASITLRAVTSTAQSYGLYALLRPWNETEATWQRATSSTTWQTGGAKGAADRGDVVGSISGSGTVTAELNASGIALVQSWLDPPQNHGIIIANATNTDGVDFASSEYATSGYRPKLTVTYTAPDPGDGGAPSDASSSTISFIPRGAVWRYRADGSNQGTAWRSSTFDDATWSSGSAQLGYGEADEATVIPSGPRTARYITSYFRRRFDVVDAASIAALTLSIERDDGAIVYVNGVEVFRTNMPSSAVTYTTLASASVEDGPWFSASISPSLLVTGSNVVAVELHQRSRTDSDASFDFELTGRAVTGDAGDAGSVDDAAGADAGDDGSVDDATGTDAGDDGSVDDAAGADAGDDGSVDDAVGGDASDDDAGGIDVADDGAADTSDGTPPGATVPNLLVAFIADQGNTANSDAVLELIRSEGASAAVHNGDFDYLDNPPLWNDRIDRILGPDYPYFAIVGNHDGAAWAGATGYASYIAARHARVPEMQCQGELGVKATCNFRGLYLVESCVGTTELRATCAKDSPEQVQFLRNSLAARTSLFSVCLWHKNQSDMQIGTKTDEVGWNAYSECSAAGALVVTGHEHSYARTKALSNIGNAASGHGATGAFDALQLAPGRTIVLVSGLGGDSIRAYDATRHDDDTWWASYYASNRWLQNGMAMTGTGTHGALFIRFHVDGNAKRARAYFKDITGRVADEFTIDVP